MSEFDLSVAKYNDMLSHAKNVLGLDVPHGISKPALMQLVSAQMGQKVPAGVGGEVSGMAEADKLATKNMKDLRAQKKIRIRIHENKEHPKRIPVCVNGIMFTLKQGVWVDVPESVVEVLRNAVATTYSQHEDANGKLVTVSHESLQFPFEVNAQHYAV